MGEATGSEYANLPEIGLFLFFCVISRTEEWIESSANTEDCTFLERTSEMNIRFFFLSVPVEPAEALAYQKSSRENYDISRLWFSRYSRLETRALCARNVFIYCVLFSRLFYSKLSDAPESGQRCIKQTRWCAERIDNPRERDGGLEIAQKKVRIPTNHDAAHHGDGIVSLFWRLDRFCSTGRETFPIS